MFTYSHANTPLGQSERAYYLSYFINTSTNNTGAFPSASVLMDISIYVSLIRLRYVFNNVVYRINCYKLAKSVCGLINVVKVMSFASVVGFLIKT